MISSIWESLNTLRFNIQRSGGPIRNPIIAPTRTKTHLMHPNPTGSAPDYNVTHARTNKTNYLLFISNFDLFQGFGTSSFLLDGVSTLENTSLNPKPYKICKFLTKSQKPNLVIRIQGSPVALLFHSITREKNFTFNFEHYDLLHNGSRI